MRNLEAVHGVQEARESSAIPRDVKRKRLETTLQITDKSTASLGKFDSKDRTKGSKKSKKSKVVC